MVSATSSPALLINVSRITRAGLFSCTPFSGAASLVTSAQSIADWNDKRGDCGDLLLPYLWELLQWTWFAFLPCGAGNPCALLFPGHLPCLALRELSLEYGMFTYTHLIQMIVVVWWRTVGYLTLLGCSSLLVNRNNTYEVPGTFIKVLMLPPLLRSLFLPIFILWGNFSM